MRRRLANLPVAGTFPSRSGSVVVRLANTFKSRLWGLAGPSVRPDGELALLLPGTKSIHTFGMAFAIDLVWLDRAGRVVRVDEAVRPRRFRSCRRANAVLELSSAVQASLTPKEGVRLSLQTHTLGDLLPSKGA